MNKNQKKKLDVIIQKAVDLEKEIKDLKCEVKKDLPNPEESPSFIKAQKTMFETEVEEAERFLAVAKKERYWGSKLAYDDSLNRDLELAATKNRIAKEKFYRIQNKNPRGRALAVCFMEQALDWLADAVITYLEKAKEE